MPINREQQRDEKGRFISDKDAEARRVAEEKRDKATTKAAETLHQDFKDLAKSVASDFQNLGSRSEKLANVNSKIIKDNAKFFNDKAEGFLNQSSELEATVELGDLNDLLKEQVGKMVDISSEAATADFATLKKLKNESLASLKSLELLAQTDDSDQMAELIDYSKQQLKMLTQETTMLSTMGEGITSIAKTGLGALAGVVSGNPILAMGVQAIQSGFEKRSEDQRRVVESQLETAKKQKQQLLTDAVEAKEQAENLDSEAIATGFADSLSGMMAELVPEDATEEETSELLADVSSKLEDLVDATDEEKSLFSSWLAGSEEERREALDMDKDKLEVFGRMADALESLDKDKKDDDELGIGEVAIGNVIADAVKKAAGFLMGAIGGMFTAIFTFLGKVPKMIGRFLAKGLPKLLTRFFAPVAIIGALFSGISDAIDEYAKSGSIFEAVIAGLSGILDFITFGLVNEEMGKKIFHAITDTFLNIKDAIAKNFAGFGDGFINIVKGAFSSVIDGAINMWDEFVADFMNISDFLTKQEWFQKFMDVVGPGVDAIITMGTKMVSLVTGIWTVAQEKWESIKNGIGDIFDWFADIFSIETFKKLIPEGILSDALFGKQYTPDELTEMEGIERAKETGAINRNLGFRDSTIDDVDQLNTFTAKQLRDLIDLDDWSREDEDTLRDLWNKKLREETSTNDNVIDLDSRRPEVVQQPKTEIVQVAADTQPSNEVVSGETQAQKVDAAIISFQKASEDKQERQQVNQRKLDAESAKTAVQVNNNTRNSTTNISTERTFDVDPSITQSENRNQVG